MTLRTFSTIRLTGLVVALCAAPLLANAQAEDLLAQGRNFADLNTENLTPAPFVVPPAPGGATQFRFRMKGYVFGLRIMRADYTGYFDNARYAAYADIKTSGLARLLKKLEIWAVSAGRIAPDGLRPDFHVQQNLDKKNRRVEMRYGGTPAGRAVDVAIFPPLGSQGVPPASPSERANSYDTVSAILSMMMVGQQISGELCNGIVPVFDSKQRYNLRMVRLGTKRVKFDGGKDEAIHCHAYYEPVSGFDPEDLPDSEEASTPINVYFKYDPAANIHIPVRFTYKISSITAVIKVDEMEIIAP